MAIVIPDKKEFEGFASKHGGSGSLEELCKNKQVGILSRQLVSEGILSP